MAKLPSWRRILEQDYPAQYQDLVKQLAVSLNYGMDSLYQTLNGRLTFKDNIESTIGTFICAVDKTGAPTTTVAINKSNTDTLSGVIVIKVTNQTSASVFPTSGVFVTYTETVNQVIINNITGLLPNNNYQITILGVI